jgi:IclR family transcriptional regulator, pca regulon regulatory protein
MPKVNATEYVDVDGERMPSIPTLRVPRFSQSLERGLAILECFTPERPVWGIADLADALGMSPSTTHRYVLTLTQLGYLVQGARRKYRLTLSVTDLGMSAMNGTSLQEHARSSLEDLRRETGFTVVVGVLDGPEVLLVDYLRGNHRGQQKIDLGQAPGSRLPVHCTAVGKLLLAHLPEREQRRVISELTLRRRTTSTIIRKKALREELSSIREWGIAAAEEEFASGLYSIAVPVRLELHEVVAAVGMDSHSSMITMRDLVDKLGPHLIATADRVSARLGYRREDERAAGR